MEKQRYLMTVSFYIWEKSDKKAIKKAKKWAKKQREKKDTRAKVFSLEAHPFGSLKLREIEINQPKITK